MRSAYSADFAFYRGLPDLTSKVLWFFVPEKLQRPMPFATAFASTVWSKKDEIQPPIGERFHPVPWSGGLPPFPIGYGGVCGTEKQWQYGCEPSDPIPATWPGTNVPKCCLPPPGDVNSGVRTSGNVFAKAGCPGPPYIPAKLSVQTLWNGVGSGPPPGPVTFPTICLDNLQGTSNWFSGGPRHSYLMQFCGSAGGSMQCVDGEGWSITFGPTFADPPCADTDWFENLPYGNLLSYQRDPFQFVFGPEDQSIAQWNFYVTPALSDCLIGCTACTDAFGSTRTLTIVGPNVGGVITAAQDVVNQTWTFETFSLPGCNGQRVWFQVQCGGIIGEQSMQLTTLEGSCIPGNPGQTVYLASAVNCDPIFGVWGFDSGVVVTFS